MAMLITGAGGMTALPIAHLCSQHAIPFLLTSRGGPSSKAESYPCAKFDWTDESTWSNVLDHGFPDGKKLTAAYITAPRAADPISAMLPFVKHLVSYGVTRFILAAGTSAKPGGPMMGGLWQWMIDNNVEHGVMKPSWFTNNLTLTDFAMYARTINEESKFYTVTGDGKIPFVTAEDIAAVAFHALTDEKPIMYRTEDAKYNEYYIVGPELLTYDQVAQIMSDVLGRRIEHVKMDEDEFMKTMMTKYGMNEQLAGLLVMLESLAAGGLEDRMNDVVEKVTGRKPRTVREYVERNKSVWL